MYGYLLGLIFTCILYLFIAIYLDNVLPQGTALNKKWNYIFKFNKSEERNNPEVGNIDSNNNNNSTPNQYIEPDPENVMKVVEVNSLFKYFNTGKKRFCALNNINFNVYSNEIFAIIGHNGAGKSTLLNIMTGLYHESSGRILYDDKIFKDNKDQICSEIGNISNTLINHFIFFKISFNIILYYYNFFKKKKKKKKFFFFFFFSFHFIYLYYFLNRILSTI